MGSYNFDTLIHGKTLNDAFRSAAEEDRYEFGHDPYSGTIGQKNGAVLIRNVKMPRARKTGNGYAKNHDLYHEYLRSPESVLADLIWNASVDERLSDDWWSTGDRKRIERDRKELEKYVPRSEWPRLASCMSKWENPAAIELTGAALAKAKKRLHIDGTHQKVWLVLGWAAC